MSAIPIKHIEIDATDPEGMLKYFRLGECVIGRIPNEIHDHVSQISAASLQNKHGSQITRLLNVGELGKALSLEKFYLQLNQAESDRSISRYFGSTVPLSSISPQLNRALAQLPILSPWNKLASILWIAKTSPSLHYDAWDNIVLQLSGTKSFRVYNVKETEQIEKRNVFARHQSHGQLTAASETGLPYYEGIPQPGDLLIIPCGALHGLGGSSDGISLNCFLGAGPLPLAIKYKYLYWRKTYLVERLLGLIPDWVADFLATKLRYPRLQNRKMGMKAIPRVFWSRKKIASSGTRYL